MFLHRSIPGIIGVNLYNKFLSGALHIIFTLYFLWHKIGTDPKEARYWLRQFQNHESAPDQPFAVVQVDSEIMEDKVMVS